MTQLPASTVEAFIRGMDAADIHRLWGTYCSHDRVLSSGRSIPIAAATSSALLAAMLEPYEFHEDIEELLIAASDLLALVGTGGLATRQVLALGEAVAETPGTVPGNVRPEFDRRLRLSLGKLVLYVNVEALRAADQEARRDSLTGLRNRRAFDHDIASLVEAAATSPSVAFIDVDGLKRVNDTEGHEAGDDLLRRVAEVLSGTCDGGEYAYRFAGDEYAFLTPLRTADELLELMRSLSTDDVPFSFGVASQPADGETPADLTRVADQRMYACKADRKRHPNQPRLRRLITQLRG